MFTLEITDTAEYDFDRITDYLGITLANPQAALSLLDEMEQLSGELESNPSVFPLCAADNLAAMGYHKAILKSYIVVFEIEGNAIRILRVFHSSENYTNKF